MALSLCANHDNTHGVIQEQSSTSPVPAMTCLLEPHGTAQSQVADNL